MLALLAESEPTPNPKPRDNPATEPREGALA
jgi:hypothetical protein